MIQISNKPWDELVLADITSVIERENESIHFEWKEDNVSTDKFAKEVSAFANTYGGYIVLGVDDSGEVRGCDKWNEQRIHNVVHNMVFPLPVFDVKRLTTEDGRIILVTRVEEGTEPPYVTNKGILYERVSSGSFPIKNSDGLMRLYHKRKDHSDKIEQKLTIPPIRDTISNMYAYIDMGFAPFFADEKRVTDRLFNMTPEELLSTSKERDSIENAVRVGNTFLITLKALSSEEPLPAHANCFMEVLPDGSVRTRILVINNEGEPNINMFLYDLLNRRFQSIYEIILGKEIEKSFLYAKKYMKLTVLKQFHPTYFFDEVTIQSNPDYYDLNEKIFEIIRQRRERVGVDKVVTDARMPSIGLYQIDRGTIEKVTLETTIADHLFYCPYVTLGFSDTQQEMMTSFLDKGI